MNSIFFAIREGRGGGNSKRKNASLNFFLLFFWGGDREVPRDHTDTHTLLQSNLTVIITHEGEIAFTKCFNVHELAFI